MSEPPPPSQPARRRALPGRIRWVVSFGVAGIVVVLDQATKELAVQLLADGKVDLGWFDLNLIRNPNAAFSIPGPPGFFLIVTVVVVVVVVRTLPSVQRLSLAFGYGLLLGGALGNAMDRIFRFPGLPSGHVVDFVDLRWWPVFNLADSSIVTGAFLVALLAWRLDREERAVQPGEHRSVRPETGSPRQ